MKLMYPLLSMLVFLSTSAFANDVILNKTLISVAKCASTGNKTPGQSLELGYSVTKSNLRTESINGVNSYLVQLFQGAAYEGIDAPKVFRTAEIIIFAGSTGNSSALEECNNVRNFLLQQIH